MSRYCIKCGSELKCDSKFCGVCGCPVTQTGTVQQVQSSSKSANTAQTTKDVVNAARKITSNNVLASSVGGEVMIMQPVNSAISGAIAAISLFTTYMTCAVISVISVRVRMSTQK